MSPAHLSLCRHVRISISRWSNRLYSWPQTLLGSKHGQAVFEACFIFPFIMFLSASDHLTYHVHKYGHKTLRYYGNRLVSTDYTMDRDLCFKNNRFINYRNKIFAYWKNKTCERNKTVSNAEINMLCVRNKEVVYFFTYSLKIFKKRYVLNVQSMKTWIRL